MPNTTSTSSRSVRRRLPIGSIGVGLAVLYVAVASAAEAIGWWDATALWVIVTALAIVMVALVASTIVNRSWWLPVPLVLLAGATTMLCIAQPDLDGATGTRRLHPTTVAAAEQTQHLAAGNLEIDLRDVPHSGDVHVTAEVGMGLLRVFVPAGADLHLITDVGMGNVRLDGHEIVDGVRQQDTRDVSARSEPSEGTFVLDLRAGMGSISIETV